MSISAVCLIQNQLNIIRCNTQLQFQSFFGFLGFKLFQPTSRFWSTIDALQNRRLASYLPGSGVTHADSAEQPPSLRESPRSLANRMPVVCSGGHRSCSKIGWSWMT
jgi:hypothetical protein